MRYALPTVVATMALAACGGGGDNASQDTDRARSADAADARPTKAEYIRDRDRKCAENRTELRPLVKAMQSAAERVDFQDTADAIDEWIAKVRPLLDETEDLPKPRDGIKLLEKRQELQERQIAIMEKSADSYRALASDDAVPFTRAIGELEALEENAEKLVERDKKLAREYGFKVCGDA